MKERRKKELLRSFPDVPPEYTYRMLDGKGAANFVVLLTRGQELYVRCFHKYSEEKIIDERQRYVFAKDGCVRYGERYDQTAKRFVWCIRKDFREPVFYLNNMGYRNNSYIVLNKEAIFSSDMRYFPMPMASLFIEWLGIYCKHPNVEYLVKAGYRHLIRERCTGYWGNKNSLAASVKINWKSNNLLKMLGLNREEFRLLQGHESEYENYIDWRERYPRAKPQELMKMAKIFGYDFDTAKRFSEATGKTVSRIAAYLDSQDIKRWNYRDYIEQCRTLRYDLHDTAICFPHDFDGMHTRLSSIIKYKEDEQAKTLFAAAYECRRKFGFSFGGLIIIQPEKFSDIIKEGEVLCHCVGGYAGRHACGQTNIFFIRKESEPDKPYYTIEVDNDYRIVQCHGYRNDINGKPEEIKIFEAEYKKYLEVLKQNERDQNKRAV